MRFSLVSHLSTRGRRRSSASHDVHMEPGHATPTTLLQTEALGLGLGGVPAGAFDDARLGRLLDAGRGEEPLSYLPIGVLAGTEGGSSEAEQVGAGLAVVARLGTLA